MIQYLAADGPYTGTNIHRPSREELRNVLIADRLINRYPERTTAKTSSIGA